MSELPSAISPCANVRRSCNALMKDPLIGGQNREVRSVSIDEVAIDALAEKISQSILDKFQKEIESESNSGIDNIIHSLDKESVKVNNKTCESALSMDDNIVDGCIENLNFASWDEENWHYTASNFHRSNLSKEIQEKHKFERVALYIMCMDCINFCFWPVSDDTEVLNCAAGKNLLEYEHLASALKVLASRDDRLQQNDETNVTETNSGMSMETNIDIICADDSFLLAPQNLVNLTEESFLNMMLPLLPTTVAGNKIDENPKDIYMIPNAKERVRLMVEMAEALLTFHDGSASAFISKAGKSADKLVHLILQFFPGFRDATVDPFKGRWVAFYKRAQILVADLWAALGNDDTSADDADKSALVRCKFGVAVCNFTDMNKITTFADYRVPQLLRSLSVLKYSSSLAKRIDSGVEIDIFSMDELYIRASTVQAVDILVDKVSLQVSSKVDLEINSVKMDWFLWNIGEKLDREGNLGVHHKVRTIFY